MILKLGMKHKGNELYKVYINHDPGMTLTYFMTRSTMHLNGEKRKNGFNVKNLLGMSKMDRKFIFLLSAHAPGPCARTCRKILKFFTRSQVSIYRTIGPLVSV